MRAIPNGETTRILCYESQQARKITNDGEEKGLDREEVEDFSSIVLNPRGSVIETNFVVTVGFMGN